MLKHICEAAGRAHRANQSARSKGFDACHMGFRNPMVVFPGSVISGFVFVVWLPLHDSGLDGIGCKL